MQGSTWVTELEQLPLIVGGGDSGEFLVLELVLTVMLSRTLPEEVAFWRQRFELDLPELASDTLRFEWGS